MPTDTATLDPMAAAIGVFTRRGYDATTVDDLADAVELSRSSFFRRFGSKEDVVFADHELLLARVEAYLETMPLTPLRAVCAAARLVLDHHVDRREVSVARFALLHEVPALRDRELVTTHRYERAFAHHLRSTLPGDTERDYLAVAFSAGVVALHNMVLRDWLAAPATDPAPRLDAQLRALITDFTRPRESSRVVVTVFDAGTASDDVIDSIRAALR